VATVSERTTAQRLATLDRQVAQCHVVMANLLVWLQEGNIITLGEARKLFKLLEDPK